MAQTILKSHNLDPVVQKDFIATLLYMKKTENKENLSLEEFINQKYQEDPLPNHVFQLSANGVNYSKDLIKADCAIVNNRLHYWDHLYASNYHDLCLHLCHLHYDSLHVGHLEIDNTNE